MEKIKHIFLKYIKGYGDEQKYWDSRWKLGLKNETLTGEYQKSLVLKINSYMIQFDCNSFLDLGCGEAQLRNIPGYLGLDFSLEAIKKSRLEEAIFADITNRIPLPDKSVDMAFAMVVFLHIPPAKIDRAISEVCRVTKKCVFLVEPKYNPDLILQKHCFSYDLKAKIQKQFNGELIIENTS